MMLDAEDMRMGLGRARREDQTPGCWGARTGGEGEDGGPRKGETALPGAADAGGLARTRRGMLAMLLASPGWWW